MADEKHPAAAELDEALRAYIAGDLPARVDRLEKRVDEVEPRVEHATTRAEEAVQVAQGVSFEWHDQSDALVRHVEQQGASIREHFDSLTRQQNERIELALTESRAAREESIAAREVSERQLRAAKKSDKLLARMARAARMSTAERRHQLRSLSVKIPLYTAIVVAVGGIIATLVNAYVISHGAPSQGQAQPTIVSAPHP